MLWTVLAVIGEFVLYLASMALFTLAVVILVGYWTGVLV